MRELCITPNNVMPKWNYPIARTHVANGIYSCTDPQVSVAPVASHSLQATSHPLQPMHLEMSTSLA